METPRNRHDDARPPEDKSSLTSVARGSGGAALGMTYGATILLFVGAGWWLDERLGTKPWLLIVGLFLGSAGGFVSLLKKVPPAGSGRSSGGSSKIKK